MSEQWSRQSRSCQMQEDQQRSVGLNHQNAAGNDKNRNYRLWSEVTGLGLEEQLQYDNSRFAQCTWQLDGIKISDTIQKSTVTKGLTSATKVARILSEISRRKGSCHRAQISILEQIGYKLSSTQAAIHGLTNTFCRWDLQERLEGNAWRQTVKPGRKTRTCLKRSFRSDRASEIRSSVGRAASDKTFLFWGA